MKKTKASSSNDRALGLDQPISRRDFLNSSLLATGSALLGAMCPMQLLAQHDWAGYGGVGDYRTSNGNTLEVMAAGHKIRDQVFESSPASVTDTHEHFDCVVIGGGISGLAAALFFARTAGPNKTCLVLDNHPIFGGEAKRNEFVVDGERLIAHQGSAVFFPPFPNTFLADCYKSLGIDWRKFEYQSWAGKRPEMPLGLTPYTEGGKNSGFYFGAKFGRTPGMWMVDPFGKKLEGAPISAQSRRELLRMNEIDSSAQANGDQPKEHGDKISRRLDSISLEQHMMEKYGMSRETIRTFLSPVSGGGSGLGPDALSAYSDYAADVLLPWDTGKGAQMFPGGNTGIARHITKALLPGAIAGPSTLEAICKGRVNFLALDRPGHSTRIRLRSTALSVQHQGEPNKSGAVQVSYLRDRKVYRVTARTVVMAGGGWTAKHILQALPEEHSAAYAQFFRSPCLMANVAVRNWRFLEKLGMSECQWFEGFGNYMAVRKTARFGGSSQTISADSAVVLSIKVLFSYPGEPIEEQGKRGRYELLATPFQEYERRIRQQFTEMFARSGFDARRDIAGIILNRWGHAYLNPQPGFFFGSQGKPAPSQVLRAAPFGRIAFANTDLAGIMDHRTSILEAQRAVSQLIPLLD